jgi:hypothetical protein
MKIKGSDTKTSNPTFVRQLPSFRRKTRMLRYKGARREAIEWIDYRRIHYIAASWLHPFPRVFQVSYNQVANHLLVVFAWFVLIEKSLGCTDHVHVSYIYRRNQLKHGFTFSLLRSSKIRPTE